MRRGTCKCKNRLYIGNTVCLCCSSQVGWCERCRQVTSVDVQGDENICTLCMTKVAFCKHRESHCNVLMSTESQQSDVCSICLFTKTIPDSSIPQNKLQWAALESAKRRFLLELQDLEMPPFSPNWQPRMPLFFEFKSDIVDDDGEVTTVYTGHSEGVITINTKEADPVFREQSRVDFGEPQRTLIGHMRHEYGHYVDLCCLSDFHRPAYIALFGDPNEVDYQTAKEQYYSQGPRSEWRTEFASAYASMHPWEDFAESMNLYLDIMAIRATAIDLSQGHWNNGPEKSFSDIVHDVLRVATAVSEYNADMGLLPLLPEAINDRVLQKIDFIDKLRRNVPEIVSTEQQIEECTI
jgi:hypothetical protein